MKNSKKFNCAAAAGLMALVLSACDTAPQPDSPPQPPKKTVYVNADACQVVDLLAHGRPGDYTYDTYDFRLGAVLIRTDAEGYPMNFTTTMPMKLLPQPTQMWAREMYLHLPATTKCPKPEFN